MHKCIATMLHFLNLTGMDIRVDKEHATFTTLVVLAAWPLVAQHRY